MPRVKLIEPKIFHFKTEISIRISDINYGGHMGNDSVLTIAHEARIRFLKSINQSENKIYNCSLIMADCAIEYKNQSFHGDKLSIGLSVTEISKIGFDLFYLITNNENTIAKIKTGIVCYDYNKKKTVRLPNDFHMKFS